MKACLELEIINGHRALNQISDDWRELTDSMEIKRFFHLIEYYRAYMDTLEKNPNSIYFFILRDGEKVAAIFPFRKVIWRIGAMVFKVLESIQYTNPQLVDFEYDFIMKRKEDCGSNFKALLDNLKRSQGAHWDLISIRNVLEDSYASSALDSIQSMKKRRQFYQNCYFMSTDSYDRIIQNTSGNFRRKLKKAKRRISELGPSSFVSIKEFPELEGAYDNFLNLEGSAWKRELGTAIIQHEDAANFYRSLISHYKDLNCCEIHELRLKDQAIASFFTIRDDNASYLPKIGYDEQFDEVSPGKLLMDFFINRCCKMQPSKELIFLSNASHLEHWEPSQYIKLNYYLFNSSFQGELSCILKMFRDAVRPYDNYLLPYYKFVKIDAIRNLVSILSR